MRTYSDASGHAAVPAVHSALDEVLDNLASANRARLGGRRVTAHVVPLDRKVTDIPIWADLRGKLIKNDEGEVDPYGREYDDLPGVARCKDGDLDVAVGEEQMVDLPGGLPPALRRSPPASWFGTVLVHEVGHIVACAGLTTAQQSTLTELHEAARDAFEEGDTSDIIGRTSDPKSFAYTTWTEGEFFAEATAAWFQRTNEQRYRRGWVQAHDPGLYALLDEVYSVPPAPRYCEGERATTVIKTPGRTFTGYPGPDIIVGSPGNDVIFGEGGGDIICGEGGDDALYGGGSDDILNGGPGHDELRGSYGDDFLFGKAGEDLMYGDDGRDFLYGGPGNDVMNGGAGVDYLSDDRPPTSERPPEPGGGDDKLYGGPGNDTMLGGDSDDYFYDDAGRDDFYGEGGNDEIRATDKPVPVKPGQPAPTPVPDYIDGGSGTNSCTNDRIDTVVRCAPPGWS